MYYRFTGLIAVLGLLTLLVGFIVIILLPDIRYAAWVILALGVALLAIAFIIDFRRVGSAITGKRGRFSTGTMVMVSVFIGITLLVNAISIGNYQRFDITGLAQFTLTSQTQDVLNELETPVRIIGFFTPGDPIGAYANALLTEYAYVTSQLSLDLIDPDEQPELARNYGITQYGTVVFENVNQHRLVTPEEIVEKAEHSFTSAILEVTGIVQKKVYFLTGHGESNINSTATNGYFLVRVGLLNDLYLIEILNLITNPGIPPDCAVLIIAGPQKPLASSEIEIIENYLKTGGQILILINPDPPAGIEQILSPWGIELESGIIIDPTSHITPNKDIPLVPMERGPFFNLPATYFPGATAIIPDEEESQKTAGLLPLVWTSTESWLERNFDPEKDPIFDDGIDLTGPFAIGIILAAAPPEAANEEVTEEGKLTRLIVIGDSDFASNEHFYNGNNGDLFLNSVNWLAEETELIAVHRKVLPFRRLLVGPEIINFIRISSIGLLPLIVLFVGSIIWWRRR